MLYPVTTKVYFFSDYKWIREWIESDMIKIEGEGKSAFLFLTENGDWVTDAESKDEFLNRIKKFLQSK